MKLPIYVTQPSMPPIDDFFISLKEIWGNKLLTNNGPFHQELEKKLADYLGVGHLSLFSNGTLALITALQALKISGEVITTPFSFVATTHSLWWNNIKPVFVDIEPDTFNIDADKIEAAITPKTTAIMPVHVYGHPCDVYKIKKIADNYGLKIIYDAAHAFGVKINGESILNYGNLSILSFHATKVFNTIEGGAIISPDLETKQRIDNLKNFGFLDETTVIAPGINAKMNEIQSAYGLLQLAHVNENISKRKQIVLKYREFLSNIPGISFNSEIINVEHNYSYFPILVDKLKYGISRDDLYDKLKTNNIFGRRYFYPLISQFPTYSGLESSSPQNLKIATIIADQVICLPIYPELEIDAIKYIAKIVKNNE